ncbi:MAG: inositol monophosphatase [Methanocorpusculum sp.]|nr:inositol monophosphatase [Methanocorpusculum sp.]
MITVVILIYVSLIQVIVACTSGDLLNGILLSIIPKDTVLYDFFSENTVHTFINIFLFGCGYAILFAIANFTYRQIWVRRNKSCYLAGRWYHIHTKDGNKDYIRTGTVDIEQNYFDLDVEASNFEPVKYQTKGEIIINIDPCNHNITHWRYNIVELSERGGILSIYTSHKAIGSTRIYKGIHELHVIDYDARGYPSILEGTFADIAPSTSQGSLWLYRVDPVPNFVFYILYSIKNKFINTIYEIKRLTGKELSFENSRSQTFKSQISISSNDKSLSQSVVNWKDTLINFIDRRENTNMNKCNIKSPSDMTDKEILSRIIAIVDEAGDILLEASEKTIAAFEKGSYRDIYTKYDVEIQQKIIADIKNIFPNAEFIAEEGDWSNSEKLSSEYCFIIDPIDGTSNFTRDYKHSCISVAVAIKGDVRLGVVYDPYLGEIYSAIKGEGAYLNNKTIVCSKNSLRNSVVGFGTAPYNLELTHETFAFSEYIFSLCNDLRRSGSSALDLCYVAAGRLDLFYELSLYPWDYAAAGLIAKEAGAIITDLDGKELVYTKKCSVVSGGNLAYTEFMLSRNQFISKFR